MSAQCNLIFDADVLADSVDELSARSGIYFTARCILEQLASRPEINVCLYCSPERLSNLSFLRRSDRMLARLPLLKIYTPSDFAVAALNQYMKKLKHHPHRKILRRFLKIPAFLISGLNLAIRPLLSFFRSKELRKWHAYFSPMHPAPKIICKAAHIRRYLFLHDTIPLLFPEFYPQMKNGNCWFAKLLSAMNNTQHYFANSLNTKRDFLYALPGLQEDRISIVPLAASKKFFPCRDQNKLSDIRRKYNIPENASYIFSLCTLEPRKNLIFAVKAFAEFTALRQTENLYFVLGGASWKTFVPFLQREIKNLKDCKRFIILTGYVDDDDLAALYSDAFCFVYPSLYEGFGLPPLEAMQCGCPVIASDTSSLPEVIGNAGIMIDPRNEKSLVKAFTDLFDNPQLRQRLVQQSLRRARQFSWKTSADIIVRKIIND